MNKYFLLYLIFTFVLIQKAVSQETIIAGNMDGDLNTSFSNPPVFDQLCHVHTISLTIPGPVDSFFHVTNALINYTMVSLNGGKIKDQRSKMFFVNTSTEEALWTEGIGTGSGTLDYSRNIDIANGVYPGGTVLTFNIWAVRLDEGGFAGCNPDVAMVENESWKITIQYTPINDSGTVGIGTITPDPSAILELQSDLKGFLPPRMSELLMNFIPNPAEGLMVHCSDCVPVGLYTRKGAVWASIGSGDSGAFTKTGNNIHQASVDFNESFLFGRADLPDASLVNDTFLFFDHANAAFRGGLLTNDSKPWQPDSLGIGSFAYGENLYAPSFGEIALGMNNEAYIPMRADSFNSADRIFSIGIGNGVESDFFGFKVKRQNAITVLKSGKVGIGDATPDETLDVLGGIIVQQKESVGTPGGLISLNLFNGSPKIQLEASEAGDQGGQISLFNNASRKSIEIDAKTLGIGAGPAIELFNYLGTSTIVLEGGDSGDKGKITTDIIEIQGGSDFAEYFDVNENLERIEPGLVVCIDENDAGALKLSQEKYDRKVIGVISGANGVDAGMVMGQKGSIAFGEHAVSLIGRVYVKCNNENGLIKAGDFLTTSSTPGEAMRVKKFRKSNGAILGKALSGIDPITGFVLVFVNLQ